MLDRGITADLLEEKLMTLEQLMPEDKQLHGAVREAIRELRGEKSSPACSEGEVRDFAHALERGSEVACYLELRKQPQISAVIVQRATETMIVVHDGVDRLGLMYEGYNHTWRMYRELPSAEQRTAWKWT